MHKIFVILAAAALTAGCGNSDTASKSNADADACRTIDPKAVNQTQYICALAAELQAIADTLATVVDRPSADKAVPTLKKSRDRVNALASQRKRLNAEENLGAKGALAAMKLPKLSVASKAFIDQTIRIATNHPDLWAVIGPAIDGMDIN